LTRSRQYGAQGKQGLHFSKGSGGRVSSKLMKRAKGSHGPTFGVTEKDLKRSIPLKRCAGQVGRQLGNRPARECAAVAADRSKEKDKRIPLEK